MPTERVELRRAYCLARYFLDAVTAALTIVKDRDHPRLGISMIIKSKIVIKVNRRYVM